MANWRSPEPHWRYSLIAPQGDIGKTDGCPAGRPLHTKQFRVGLASPVPCAEYLTHSDIGNT